MIAEWSNLSQNNCTLSYVLYFSMIQISKQRNNGLFIIPLTMHGISHQIYGLILACKKVTSDLASHDLTLYCTKGSDIEYSNY